MFHKYLIVINIVFMYLYVLTNSEDKPKEPFYFTYWFNFSNFQGVGSETIRTWLQIRLERILSFLEEFYYDNDISVALAITIVRMNVESIINFFENLLSEFEGVPYDCDFFDEYDIDTEREELYKLADRVERLHSNMANLMLARVPRMYYYRPIAQMFLLNDESWIGNIVDMQIDQGIDFDSESAVIFLGAAPNYETYEKIINDFSIPDMNETNECLRQLAFHTVFNIKYPQQCAVMESCRKFVTHGTSFGYALSNRLLLLIFAKFGRNCYYMSEGEDRDIAVELCKWARMNLDMLDYGGYLLPSLMLEYMSFCTLYGLRFVLRYEYFIQIEKLYYSEVKPEMGCLKQKIDDKVELEDFKKSWWQLVRFDKDQLSKCDRHSTAMYVAALSSGLRATYQPAWCKLESSGDARFDVDCYLPRSLSYERLLHLMTTGENKYTIYDVLWKAPLFWGYPNESCGPKYIDTKLYQDMDYDLMNRFIPETEGVLPKKNITKKAKPSWFDQLKKYSDSLVDRR